jgi:ribosomal protein S18 acetylase RimI-like enzyme
LVRRALSADARAIAEVHVRAWRAGYRGLLPEPLLDALSVEERTRRWTAHLAGVATTLVACAPDVVGFSTLIDREITSLYVDPDRWRQGVGSELLRETLTAAGRGDVTLWVLARNDAAVSFYERFGFEPDGGERRDPLGPPGARAEPLQIRLRRRSAP